MNFRPSVAHLGPHLLSAALLCVATAAEAGRPFVTEDAGVLERGACEVEGVAMHASASGSPSERAWALQAGCGLGFNSQLALGYGRSRADGAKASAYALGGKTALLPGDGDALALSLAWGLNWARAGGATTFDSALANLAASRAFGQGWTLNANLGLLRVQEPRDSLATWALALEKRVAEGLDLGA